MANETHRRDFIRRLTLGAIGAPLVGGLAAAQRAFATELDALGLDTYSAATLQALRDQYLLAPDVTYLNHASIGTIPRIVNEARKRYLDVCERNPWLYMWGGAWEEPREVVRGKAARVLGCDPTDVSITHNTTEAFNVLAHGLPLGPGDEVLFSSLNHDGASVAFFHMAKARGFEVRRFPFPILDAPGMSVHDVLAAHEAQITRRTKLLVFPHVDNIVGIRHPVRDLARLARERGVEFVAVDGAQTVGMIEIDARNLGVDVYAASPHKWLQAPKGLGLAYLGARVREVLRPLWVTWGQERWHDTVRVFEDYGTRNLPEVLTLGDAIDYQSRLDPTQREARLRGLWEYTRRKAVEHPQARWRSPDSWELSASLYGVEIGGRDSTGLAKWMFEEHGVVFRPFRAQGLNSVRLSPNTFNTEAEIDRFFDLATR